MEMCYAGAIAMPSSYVVMNEEEMTYTEGGAKWNSKVFADNLLYCVEMVAGVVTILAACGVDIKHGVLRGCANYWAACSKLSKSMIKLGAKIATWNAVAAGVFLIGSVAAVWALGTYSIR